MPLYLDYFDEDALTCFEHFETFPEPYDTYSYELNELLETISNLTLDRRGPWQNFDPYGDTDFLHWNPDFITWVEHNLILSARNPNLPDYQVRLKLYLANRYRLLRMAYAWEYLNKYNDIEDEAKKYQEANLGPFKDEMLTYLARFKPDPRQNYDDGSFNEKLEGDIEWVSASYDDEMYGFRFEVGFWLRRQLDGTALQLSSLLARTIELYDPQWDKAKALFTK
ncbi:MAG: hypothetical protein LBE31_01915 [Deltaproteobacteria bacterium]|nr:hypothetical protein [Deltaproteobacteria bacterium]